MKTSKNITNKKGIISRSSSSQTDVDSKAFLGKKRFNSKSKIINQKKRKNFIDLLKHNCQNPKIDTKIEKFLNLYNQIINKKKIKDKNFSNFFSFQQKYYSKSVLNINLVKNIFEYFKRLSIFYKNNILFNFNMLFKLNNEFMIDENDFASLTLLLEQFLCFQNLKINFTDESLLYLSFYVKYLTSNEFSYIFKEMIKLDSNFKKWYSQYKKILVLFDINIQKVNQRCIFFKQNKKRIKYTDYNFMVKEIMGQNPCELIEYIKEIDTNFEYKKISNSNIGKVVDVIIVYREDTDNKDEKDYNEKTNLSIGSN